MLLPVGASSFDEAMRIVSECYHALKSVIVAKFGIAGGSCPRHMTKGVRHWRRR